MGEIKQSGAIPADGPEIAELKELDVLIYGLKNCDTCRKANKALPQAQLIDVREEGVPEAVLTQAYERFGTALLNTRSTTWRGLDDEARAEEPLALIKAYPALMKRPLIAGGDALFLGWNNDIEGEVKAML
ncbi:ArsC family protein [Sulfitobacter indolifex HEL-45]|uniref:ArsC family protein n=1 Tax=Sulfitobacter indolifex HEL-45 TaxID=391624 RepID=A0ABM9X6L4_9RHOB|nr:ArsC family protein [Sulfitobacter indolifex HEL-45]